MLRLSSRALAALALCCTVGSMNAAASDSDKPVRIIVPYAPGGVADTQARLLAQRLQARWNRSVLVENKPGGNTVVGTAYVAKAPADCNTLLLGTLSTVLNDVFYDKLPYNRKNDLAEVSLTTKVPNILVVPNNSRFKTLNDLIVYGKANPGKLAFASTGNGGASHLSGELLSSVTGIPMVHVPYSGGTAAQRDLLPGRVDFMFDSSSIQNIKAGQVRALAMPTLARSPLLPDVPTMSEAGLKDFQSVTWFGFYTPKANGKAPACIAQLSRDVAQETQNADVKARLADIGAETVGSTPEGMVLWEDQELKRWTAVVERGNIKLSQ
jgi:tripartite-type tricarboxylate transporter receptor subunit TctC